jgi:hypothetical protein
MRLHACGHRAAPAPSCLVRDGGPDPRRPYRGRHRSSDRSRAPRTTRRSTASRAWSCGEDSGPSRAPAAVLAGPAIKTLSTTGPRLPTLADARRCAPNLAWMSYLKRPCGMAGVTPAEASRELLYNGGKHVSASAAVPGMARTGPPRSADSSGSAQAGLEPALQRRHRVR